MSRDTKVEFKVVPGNQIDQFYEQLTLVAMRRMIERNKAIKNIFEEFGIKTREDLLERHALVEFLRKDFTEEEFKTIKDSLPSRGSNNSVSDI